MNIFLHGTIYGFNTNLAIPALATGNIEFDFSLLPSTSADIIKREVVFGLREPEIEIQVDDTVFSSDTVYTFVQEGNAYRTVISNSDGSVITIPSNNPLISIPFYNFKQEQQEIITFTLPNYNYGSYYTYTFTVTDEYISNIKVQIKMPEDDKYSEYSIEKVKYLIDASANTVFFNQTASDTYTIEFGNGIHGNWIPGADVKLIISKTKGLSANFSKEVKSTIQTPTQMTLYNRFLDGSVQSATIDPTQYLKANFLYSEGGSDPLSGDPLRKALVKYIQTRDNFLSENDFYNVIEKYTTDFRLLFKKMKVQENVFYLQRALRDEYQVPVRSLNTLSEVILKKSTFSGIHYNNEAIGNLTPGLYFYKIRAVDKFQNIVESDEIQATLIIPEETGSIHLYWNAIPGADHYEVYGRTSEYERYWVTNECQLKDTGDNETSIETENGYPEIVENPYVLFPEFDYYGNNFVSPFLYQFNNVYNYYEGWLFYPDLIVNFSSLEYNNANIDSTKVPVNNLPSIFINLIYNQEKKITYISLKSYQKISDWFFTITIPELDVERKSLDMIDESTFTFEYDENDGLIIDPITITIRGNISGVDVFTAKTAQISQIHDTTDLVQIPSFDYDGHNYLVDIPIIDAETFNNDKTRYLDKILNFLTTFNFEENRMISDNLEFRFLNTDSLRSFLLANCLIQGKNLYKNVNFIDKYKPISIADSPEKIPLNGDHWVIGGSSIDIESTEIDGEALKIYQESGFGGLMNAKPYCPSSSPYSIVLYGDYTTKISPNDKIRVKKATTNNINGQYHVLDVVFDGERTHIYTYEKIEVSSGEGKLFFATYEKWRKGGPDNLAKWDLKTNSWIFIDVNINDAFTVLEPVTNSYIYTDEFEYVEYSLRLPLQLKLKIIVDRDTVNQNNIDLDAQREEIILELANYLQLYMTGTDIAYYPSSIVEFVTEPRRNWIKGMEVTTTDSNTKKPFEFKNGIETYPESVIRDNIGSSKLEMLKYTSVFFWWDVDNIQITYELNN